jgi:hypothetical protein
LALAPTLLLKQDFLMATTAKRNNPKLWEKAKDRAKTKLGGKWSARAAQLAVKYYKDSGGTYSGNKSSKNSLTQWTQQDWGYTGEEGKSRYLPKAARDSLSSGEKAAGSRAKNKASAKGRQRASYTEAEKKAVRRATKQKG